MKVQEGIRVHYDGGNGRRDRDAPCQDLKKKKKMRLRKGERMTVAMATMMMVVQLVSFSTTST